METNCFVARLATPAIRLPNPPSRLQGARAVTISRLGLTEAEGRRARAWENLAWFGLAASSLLTLAVSLWR